MGEHEKCPKCGRRLSMDRGGYSRANVKSGFGFQLPKSLNCMNCGYYKEVFDDKPVVEEFKKSKYVVPVNNYPQIRKPLGDSRWLQDLISKHFETIGIMRAKGKPWKDIFAHLVAVEPKFSDAVKGSITTGFMRELRNRGKNERV